MREVSTHHNGGNFYADVRPPGADTKTGIEIESKGYHRKTDIGTEMNNE